MVVASSDAEIVELGALSDAVSEAEGTTVAVRGFIVVGTKVVGTRVVGTRVDGIAVEGSGVGGIGVGGTGVGGTGVGHSYEYHAHCGPSVPHGEDKQLPVRIHHPHPVAMVHGVHVVYDEQLPSAAANSNAKTSCTAIIDRRSLAICSANCSDCTTKYIPANSDSSPPRSTS